MHGAPLPACDSSGSDEDVMIADLEAAMQSRFPVWDARPNVTIRCAGGVSQRLGLFENTQALTNDLSVGIEAHGSLQARG